MIPVQFNGKSIFEIFDKQWALVTAGTPESFNTMTISWGGLGTLWNMPAATVYVRPSRYTHEFMDRERFFTVSFFGEEHRRALGLLGSKSGRDGDKLALTRLTARAAGDGVGYAQAALTLVCKKIYSEQLKKDRIPAEAVTTFYSGDDGIEPHYMYIGEVVYMERGA